MRTFVGLLAVTVVMAQSGCDLVKKLAESDDTKASTASADPDGLPQECVDYLDVLKCVNTKNNAATAQSQTDGVRAGFKAVVTGSGAAAAKKQCADLMTGSQAGFAQMGCTKGAAAAASSPPSTTPAPSTVVAAAASSAAAPAKVAANVVGTGPCPKGQSRIQGICRVHCMNPGYCKADEECRETSFVDPKEGAITDNYCLPRSAAKDPPAKRAAKAPCGPRTLRSKKGACDISTCKTDDDCAPHPCSIVRDGVRACSGSIDEIDPDEFR